MTVASQKAGRSWWGWGLADAALGQHERERLAGAMAARFGLTSLPLRSPPSLSDVSLPKPKVEVPAALSAMCSTSPYQRARHCYGRSYRDVARAFQGRLEHPPDVVAFPSSEADIVALLDWCSSVGVAAVPYGGGSSVVGGVECEVDERYRGAVSIDLERLDRVIEVDRVSRAGRIQAGALGPGLEDQLRPLGLTLRHFPQSFEFSTLGGWLATRSAGHFATGRTHIDEHVEALRMVTPAGTLETRRLPSSGAGPSPDRAILGSEGTLGVIVEAWMRLQQRPRFRAHADVHFATFSSAVAATRDVVQSGLFPANCRLLDRDEAALSAGTDGKSHVLLLGFESADHPPDAALRRAVEIARARGGTLSGELRLVDQLEHVSGQHGTETARTWRNAFLRAPYLRDALVAASVVVETFETSCTWDAFEALHSGVCEVATAAASKICGAARVTSRFTHVYPDGVAPYYTVYAPARSGSEVEQWDEIKSAISEELLSYGGTITHHHAVGRVHRPWYDRQRPDLFASAMQAAKSQLDPAWVLNPGVLIDRQ